MKKPILFLLLSVAALALPAVARDQAAPATPAPAAAKGFDAFGLVKTRNVFDPNRRAMRTESTTEKRDRTTRPSWFMLTGTMVTDGKTLAFFSGSRSEFSKVIPAGESVAGYKLLVVTPAQVELEHGGKSMTMGVGHRLQLEGMTDEVAASEPGPGAPPPPGAPDSATPPSPAGAAPAAGGDKNEIMRRLMERRQKEMSK